MVPTTPTMLRQIIHDLRTQQGRARQLGSEDGVPKLDWVEGTGRLLSQPEMLRHIEAEARGILARGIRHVIWAGMGGSVMTVRVLRDMHAFTGSGVTIYPLDSTDPAAINAILTSIAAEKSMSIPSGGSAQLRRLLDDVLMIGVAMGMTSEEPITHVDWFANLLKSAGLSAENHLLVMALPDSLLDQFARQRGVSTMPIQPDRGTGTGGRMSAPTTRVFLLPAALALSGEHGSLQRVLAPAWGIHDLDGAEREPEQHPFVQLASALTDAADNGVCSLLLRSAPEWEPLLPWVEQVMEESLGKGGRGVLVFGADYPPGASLERRPGMLRVHAAGASSIPDPVGAEQSFALSYPLLMGRTREECLAAVAAAFLGWQLTMAIYGVVFDIVFTGQPAVESYKARARALRSIPSPIDAVRASGCAGGWDRLVLLTPPEMFVPSPERVLSSALRTRCRRYFDVTITGETDAETEQALRLAALRLATELLNVPLKFRRAPAAYHSTEQSEMDGPDNFVSLRIVGLRHEEVLLGEYDDRFLLAQAAGTWQALVENGRTCFLLAVDGTTDEACAHATEILRSLPIMPNEREP